MIVQRHIWILGILCPIAMATLWYHGDDADEKSGIVSVLLQEIAELKTAVRKQDARIEGLEQRLDAAEAVIRDGEKRKPGIFQQRDRDQSLTSPSYRDDVRDADAASEDIKKSNKDTAKSSGSETGRIVTDDTSDLQPLKRGIRSVEQVAFSAYLDHSLHNLGIGTTIKFNRLFLNAGNAYNSFTGVFTVPITGIYFFTFNEERAEHVRTDMGLVVDGIRKVQTVVEGNASTMSSNSVILQLNAGQSVWIENVKYSGGEIFGGTGENFNTFSGFLIQ